ncbi:response regulator transcription factor [Actinokineospora bangkokensis]|uniref:DNA-binding response regulator n=1 Tax=Actinokineospora bangkokensis TaxID=1193682 RepID=A0A1Q9LMG6_9PSEU|nr:response regulator transcription factor [Actinokineospora bangkokensis]OLR93232.1 hypothetical protein BJP25_17235 [Actinokineospora bangkokensis]
MARVLVADGDAVEALVVAGALRRHGYEVEVVSCAVDAVARGTEADLVVLDLRLPGAPGLDVCAALHAVGPVPVIGTAPRDCGIDLVTGLRAGLDAYLVRPVGVRELVARADAILRRTLDGGQGWDVISCGPLRIDPRTREVFRCTELVPLTRKEFDLLRLLAAEPGEVFARRDIMARVWGDEWARSDRTIDTHVSSIRGKVGDPAVIATVRGVGFRLGYPAGVGARASAGS